MENERASKEDREAMKKAILRAITNDQWPAVDVGQVLVSIGAAMMKGGRATEAEFLDYARKTWSAQHALCPQGN